MSGYDTSKSFSQQGSMQQKINSLDCFGNLFLYLAHYNCHVKEIEHFSAELRLCICLLDVLEKVNQANAFKKLFKSILSMSVPTL